MQLYRRIRRPGGTYFFTLVTHRRSPFLSDPVAMPLLRQAIIDCRRNHPFQIDAFVLLPEHLHCIWTLPSGDADYSTRWKVIKAQFTRDWLAAGHAEPAMTTGRRRQGYRAIWQRRFWEHTIEDDEDYWQHANYIHWNPVKHGHARCPHQWPYSSFANWVADGRQSADWLCRCRNTNTNTPDPEFGELPFGE